MLEQFKKSFIDELWKRFKNPFLGAFLISWIFFNWDFLYIILFLDEKYVSILPEVTNSWNIFITKINYINSIWILDFKKSLLYPFLSSFLLVVFVEVVLTFLNIQLINIKNWIKSIELLTKEDSIKIKEELVEFKINIRKDTSLLNEEILSLESRNNDLELKINDKVNEKLNEHQEINISRIKELEKDLDSINKIAKERLEKNNYLIEEIEEFKVNINNNKIFENELKDKNNTLSINLNSSNSILANLKNENKELKNKLIKFNSPIDEKYYIEEYNKFKLTYFFKEFDIFIDEIERDPYDLWERFKWKDIKFLLIKEIIFFNEENKYKKYSFTEKWNKFVEFYLNNYNNKNDISVEDIPF